MKKFRSYLMTMLAVVSVGFLSSCGDDDEPNPKANIVFNPSAESVELAPGAPITLQVAVTSADKLKEFKMSKNVLGVTQDSVVKDFPKAGFDFNLNDVVPTTAQPGNTITYTFTVTTNKGEVSTKTFRVNVVEPVVTYTARILGNQNAAVGSFWSSSNGTVYNSTDARNNSQLIDLVFYHSSATSGDPVAAANQATIASPADTKAQEIHTSIGNWTTKNATMFKYIGTSAAVYDNATTGQDISAIYTNSSATASSFVKTLKVGDVFAFVTQAGKYGVARVTSVGTPTAANGNKSEINLNIKMAR